MFDGLDPSNIKFSSTTIKMVSFRVDYDDHAARRIRSLDAVLDGC
jgi:hypothetical protein